MKLINFAYDGVVGHQQTWHWHVNTYDDKFYPINGLFEECYYDYHAPLQTVFEKNGYQTNTLTVKDALKGSEKFVYVLTFRYLRNTILNDLSFNFFKHIPIGIIDAVNTGQCILILNDSHESALYTPDFHETLFKNLCDVKIEIGNIILLTGNHINNPADSKVPLIFWQFFETAVRLATKDMNIDTSNKFNNLALLKKFLCLNRIPRETRYYFMYKMYEKNLINHFRASLDNVNNVEDIVSYNNNLFIDQIKDEPKFKQMLTTLPWTIDSTNFKMNHWDTNKNEFSYNNLIFIVTETLFQGDINNIFLTEKTFKPISLKMPFIVIGQPLTLKRLQEAGYKTFSHLWDESYDETFDPVQRMEKVCNVVEHLSTMSTTDLANMIKQSFEILEHNSKLLQSRRPEFQIMECIKGKL